MLFTKCEIQLRSEVIGVLLQRCFDFSIVMIGAIFGTFETYFGYKIQILTLTPQKFA